MIERRGGNLDASALGRFGVDRQNLRQHFALPGHYETLIVERVAPTLFDEAGDVGILEEVFIEPGDLRKHLQVGEVLRREVFFRGFRRAARAAKMLPQFPVSRITSNQILRIGLEEILQSETTLFGGEVFCRFGGNFEKRVSRHSTHVVLDLGDQRRDEIKSLMNVGKLIQQLDHAVVILEGMQPHPGQPVAAGDEVLVKRLMLVPENYDAQNGHERDISKPRSLAGSVRLRDVTKARPPASHCSYGKELLTARAALRVWAVSKTINHEGHEGTRRKSWGPTHRGTTQS